MAAPATLTAVSLTSSNKSLDSNKRKSDEKRISALTKKTEEYRASSPQQSSMKSSNESDNSSTRSVSIFRMPKIGRIAKDSSSSNQNQSSAMSVKMETDDSISSSLSSSSLVNPKQNSSPTRQFNDDLNSQPGKRKVSLNQYRENKRLKSNDIVQNSSADVDMRINPMDNIKNSSPKRMDDDSPNTPDNQLIISPKMEDTSKDVILKSNLSEPGVKKLIKKKVVWADETNQSLVQTSFFEIDDSEVLDMHAFARQCAANMPIAQLEKLMEHDLRKRQGLQDMNLLDNDDRQNLPALPRLIRILLPDTISIPEIKSQERTLQEEREKNVLQALFIPSFLPDNPGEPDGDLLGNSTNEPISIPLEDNKSLSESNQVSSVNNDNSNSANVSIAPVNPISTPTSSLSSLALNNISPEVALILAQAKEKATTATLSNVSPSVVNTQTNPSTIIPSTSVQNLSAAANILSLLLNSARPNGTETTNVLPTNPIINPVQNLPINFNVPPPTPFSIDQILASAVSLGMLPPPALNNSVFQPLSTTYNTPTSSVSTAITSNNSSPITRFNSNLGQQSSRFNNNEHHMTNSHENNRGRNFRRGFRNNNNNNNDNNNRRNYYQNRNQNNNHNNRNIFMN